MDPLAIYIPMDRRQALAQGITIPDRAQGTALFADISGFTPMTEMLVNVLGPQRGAEELTRYLDMVYDALITELHRYSGSVIGFSGDAITCWFDEDTGFRAVACALAMQEAMRNFAAVAIPSGGTVSLAMKAAVANGTARRFLVGDPDIQVIEVLAGAILDRLAAAEHQANKGEVVLDQEAARALHPHLKIAAWRCDEKTGRLFAVVNSLARRVPVSPWPAIPANVTQIAEVRPWLLPPVFERLRSGQGDFLAELRPAVALFLRFSGIDYDGDEAAGRRLDQFIRHVQHIASRYEAFLVQLTMGDKGSYLCVAFGAPVAHEDDPVRAATAASQLRALPQHLDFITNIQIGIAQGLMRTGAYGGAMSRTYGLMGDNVNLSARLMQAAAPGQVLAGKTVYQAARETFSWERLPDIQVKGKTEPVTIYNLLGIKEPQTNRLLSPAYALPMVGRAEELALIELKLKQVLQGHGQLIGITGEAGVGKTRLLANVIRLANEHNLIGFGGECQSYGTDTSYLVWQNIWRSFFDLSPNQTLEEQIQQLEKQMAWLAPNSLDRLPLLGSVLNLEIPDNDLTRSLEAKLRKTSLQSLLVDCLRARARETPLLIVLEECHWLDPLSHDLLEVIGRVIVDLPVLLIMAYRPVQATRLQAPRVSNFDHFKEIPLTPFNQQEAEKLIRLKLSQLFGSQIEISPTLLEHIVTRAEGNPFYIEELLNYLNDRGITLTDKQALEQLDLPTSLHSLILSRIDQLSESQKITIKVASVIGRLFRAAMLWGIYPQLGAAQQVIRDLDVISRLELTVPDPSEPELTYFFKHIVTQEVAYENLPYATRAVLHQQIGEYIEKNYQAMLDQYIDLLAYHFERSENEVKKREYLLKAGWAAQAHYANASAINYYQRLLPLLPLEEQIPVNLELGKVLQLVGEWSEADARYRKALEPAEALGDRLAQARCQAAIGDLLRKQGDYAGAREWFQRAHAGFESIRDEAGVGQVLHSGGTLAAQQGNYQEARDLYEQSLTIRRKLDDKRQIANLVSNLGILARLQGNYELAHTLHQEGLSIRRESGDRWGIAVSLNNLGNLDLDQGNLALARSRLEEAITLQRQIGDKWSIANALNNLGNVARAQHDYEFALSLYSESLEIMRELGDGWQLAYLLEDIGCLNAMAGKSELGLRLVGAATALREKIGAPLSPAEVDKLNLLLEPARQGIDPETQEVLLAEGRAMSLDQAIDEALHGRPK